MNAKELVEEYLKCESDYIYFIKKYFRTFDQTKNKYVPFELFGQQEELIRALVNRDFTAVYKARQLGASTTIAAFCAAYMIFNPDRKVCIIAHKLDGSVNVLKKIKEFITDKPAFLNSLKIIGNNKTTIRLTNNSEAIAFSSSSDSLRSFTPTMVLIDECAFIPDGLSIYESVVGSSSTGSKIILCSTPNGQDPLFYETIKNAEIGKNNFYVQKMFWWRDARFNQGLVWSKEGSFINPKDEAESFELHKAGYEPTSEWFEQTKKKLNYDERRINQEYMLDFLGSKDLFIKGDVLAYASENYAKEPLRVDAIYPNSYYYEEFDKLCSYILGADISSGSSFDSSSMVIYNVTKNTLAVEFIDKVSSEAMAEIIFHFGRQYGFPLAVIDAQGGWGRTTIHELLRLNYTNIYKSVHSKEHKIEDYGFITTGANRNEVFDNFRSLVSKDVIKLESKRLIEELKDISYENGKVTHSRSGHDDLLFAYMLPLYVRFKDNLREYSSANVDFYTKLNNATSIDTILLGDYDNNPYIKYSWLLKK
jgi:hypothetical protein